ncbi:MAG TPA: molybdopterin cofactor-binding domain-containing protein [Acetobacteraceae bacterium]|nr:molybdopterin cofactor-binding domain-containing protein [Acetobacteraceae bacterium]
MPRRRLLLTMVGTSLLLTFAREGEAVVSFPALEPTGAPGYDPTIWCRIDGDGTVTVHIIRAEMGQHIGTALARILAEELEADWSRVRIEQVDSDTKWGEMVTGGSWSVWMSWDVLGRAGAAARLALIEAGASLLDVVPADCIARNGMVIAGQRSISYGDIVTRARPSRQFSADELKTIALKPSSERRLLGKPIAALDIPAKINGSGLYGIDVTIDGMVYARPKLPPTRNGAKVVSIDDSAARSIPGYLRSIALDDPSGTTPGWVMVYAKSWWAAAKAADQVAVRWTLGPGATVSEQDLQDRARALVASPHGGVYVFNDPGVDQAFDNAASLIEATYTTSTVLHFHLEPLNGVALERNGVWEIHTGCQWQTLILPVLGKALDHPAEQIVLKTYLLGGGFGRRLSPDYAVPIALASKAIGGRPVKVLLTREDDTQFDSVRSPSVQVLRMAFDAGKGVTAMQHHAAAGWPTLINAPHFMKKGIDGIPYDQFAIDGADHWYDVGAFRVRAVANDLANTTFRPGWLRSVAPGWTNWAVESFMDEAAYSVGMDPVAFRIGLLNGHGRNAGTYPDSVGGALRQRAVLQRLAEKVKLGNPLGQDTAVGLATSSGQERAMPTWVACAALVRVERSTGQVRCMRLTLVVDAGTIIDPEGAAAQVEGAALWGLSMALHEGSGFRDGLPVDRNLDSYTPLRMADTPEVDVEFMASTQKPMGLGEPATTVVAPAIGNAIFRAVGVRLRHLPMRPANLRAALKRA